MFITSFYMNSCYHTILLDVFTPKTTWPLLTPQNVTIADHKTKWPLLTPQTVTITDPPNSDHCWPQDKVNVTDPPIIS